MTTHDEPMLPLRYRVRQRVEDTADTFTLTLEAAGPKAIPPFRVGQFNMLYLFGVGEVPISVSGDSELPGELVHTIRAVGVVTRAMRALREGDVVGVRGPFGSAWPVVAAEGRDVVLVAGGIGLAPLRPVLYHLLAHRERYGQVVLLYGARSPEEMLYPDELAQWRTHLDVGVTVDRAIGDWGGNVGLVTALIPSARFDPANTVGMCCGPEIMMRFTLQALLARGVPPEQLYLSMERNMKCGVGFCGHCQYGPSFVCRDGPVYGYPQVAWLLDRQEV
jgi:NAD(P)H-flavin reductase